MFFPVAGAAPLPSGHAARGRKASDCGRRLALGALVLAGASWPAAAQASAGATTKAFVLVTEPADGLGPLYSLIASAHHSLDMTMYELEDAKAEAALALDAARGVRVRVVLDHNLAGEANRAAFDYLTAHGVLVHWAPSRYDVTHQKTITIDGRVSAIMTLNLTSQYYLTTRDFAVIDRDPADVAPIEAVFVNDFSGRAPSPEPTGDHLVWSPGADQRLVGIITSARHEVLVENEEMSEYTIVDALAADARRGVDVQVVMTYQPSWKGNLAKLAAAGVHVRTFPADARLYIHAKFIDVDPGYANEQLEIGSQNFSWASLQYNRELGLHLGPAQAGVIAGVTSTFRSDFAAANGHLPR